jgi:hypothetical protein
MKNGEIDKIDFSNWPLPDSYLVEIGRLISVWNAMETFLRSCIGKLTGFDELMDPKPFILVNHSSFPQKLDMLSSLCELLKDDFPNLKDYEKTISKLITAQKSRNLFIHNSIAVNPNTGKLQIAKASARGKIKASVDNIEIVDIKRAIMDIDEAHTSLYKLVINKDIDPAWKHLKETSP